MKAELVLSKNLSTTQESDKPQSASFMKNIEIISMEKGNQQDKTINCLTHVVFVRYD